MVFFWSMFWYTCVHFGDLLDAFILVIFWLLKIKLIREPPPPPSCPPHDCIVWYLYRMCAIQDCSILLALLDSLRGSGFLTDDLALPKDFQPGSPQSYMGVCKLPGKGRRYRRLDIKLYPTCVPPSVRCVVVVVVSGGILAASHDTRHRQDERAKKN